MSADLSAHRGEPESHRVKSAGRPVVVAPGMWSDPQDKGQGLRWEKGGPGALGPMASRMRRGGLQRS